MLGCTFNREELPSSEPEPLLCVRPWVVISSSQPHHKGDTAVPILQVRKLELGEIRNLSRITQQLQGTVWVRTQVCQICSYHMLGNVLSCPTW